MSTLKVKLKKTGQEMTISQSRYAVNPEQYEVVSGKVKDPGEQGSDKFEPPVMPGPPQAKSLDKLQPLNKSDDAPVDETKKATTTKAKASNK